MSQENIPDLSDLYSAVICDALDQAGYRRQALGSHFTDYTGSGHVIGRAKTTLWVEMYHEDENPYDLELEAVDSCESDELLVCAAGGSHRSGIWGELLTTAAMNRGCRGVLVHGAIRDIGKMREMQFPVFATGNSPYDSQNRQRVVDLDVVVEIDGVTIQPRDLIFGDEDGIVVIPQQVENEVLRLAREKVNAENESRDAIRNGMKAAEAYRKYGVL
ncbi:MAG: RraA family protein [Balneolaceae bacterium]